MTTDGGSEAGWASASDVAKAVSQSLLLSCPILSILSAVAVLSFVMQVAMLGPRCGHRVDSKRATSLALTELL